MTLRICGFFTDARYEALALRMKASAEALGYPVTLYNMPQGEDPNSTWSFAVRHKPVVVERCMLEYPQDSILYLDADCEMRAAPKLLEREGFDVAANVIRPKHIHGCSMFFRGTLGLKYAKAWGESFELRPAVKLDEVHAYYALEELKKVSDFRFMALPFSYAWDRKTARTMYPGSMPVIEHHSEGRGSDRDAALRETAIHLPM